MPNSLIDWRALDIMRVNAREKQQNQSQFIKQSHVDLKTTHLKTATHSQSSTSPFSQLLL